MLIQLDDEFQIDLNTMPKHDWEKIKREAKFLIETGHTKDVGKAYISAFFLHLEDLAILATPFDPNTDKFN